MIYYNDEDKETLKNIFESKNLMYERFSHLQKLENRLKVIKNQLEDAKERESFYQNQIETMQRLLEAPKTNMTTFTDQKPNQDIATDSQPKPELKDDRLTTPEQTENKRIPVPEQVEPEQPKRGWLSRFFLPNG